MKKLYLLTVCLLQICNLSHAQDYYFAKGMGAAEYDVANAIAVDPQGNMYTTGSFRGEVDFDPGTNTYLLKSLGENDIFIQKSDPAGNLIWAKSIGGTSYDSGLSIALDDNNVYVTGFFGETADFNPGDGSYPLSSAGRNDIFILKLDQEGSFAWAHSFGSGNYDQGNAVTIDPEGAVYFTGGFEGTVDFDPGDGEYALTSGILNDIFILKLNDAGNFIWAKSMGADYYDNGADIKTDGDGNIFVCGSFQDVVAFEPGAQNFTLTSLGESDIFVTKFDKNGNLLFALRQGSTGSDIASALVLDHTGLIYVTGYFSGEVEFVHPWGSTVLNSAGEYDVFVEKFNTDGDLIWVNGMGSFTWDEGKAIAADAQQNIYVTGHFSYTADFDPGEGLYEATSTGGSDIFVQKLDPDGKFIWVKTLGAAADEVGYGLSVDQAGSIYLVGNFSETVDFDPTNDSFPLTAAGEADMFISKWGYCALDASVSEMERGLSSNASQVTYQWLDCNNSNTPISGATFFSFTPEKTGIYAVQITDLYGLCVATSACYPVTVAETEEPTGLEENNFELKPLYYPNPNAGSLHIEFKTPHESLTLRISSITGQLISKTSFENTSNITVELPGPKGLYFILINNEKQQKTVLKIVKE